MASYAELHQPILPILRRVLAGISVRPGGAILDLACGEATKWPLYREAFGQDCWFVGLDWDQATIRSAAPPVLAGGLPLPAPAMASFIIGAAQQLPFSACVFDSVLCIAALGLFADAPQVLAELKRVLRPGAAAVLVTAERRWAEVLHWPAALVAPLAEAAMHTALPRAHADLTGDLETIVQRSGFASVAGRAFLLEANLPPAVAELALLPWAMVRPRLAAQLHSADLLACDQLEPEIELCSTALVCVARSGLGA